jgi:DNA-binding LytR/AlgR family response regulator
LKYALIVEDDLGFALEVEMLLNEVDKFKIFIASDATEAYQIFREHTLDLMLIDIRLKGKTNGIEFYKATKKRSSIPTIFFSGYENEAYYQAIKQNSQALFLIKPFSMLSLRSAIETILPKEEEQLAEHLFIKYKKQHIRIGVADVRWIQVKGNYCYIYTHGEKYVVKSSLNKLLQPIKKEVFLTIYKGISINPDYVQSVNLSANKLTIGGTELPISKRYYKVLRSRLKF